MEPYCGKPSILNKLFSTHGINRLKCFLKCHILKFISGWETIIFISFESNSLHQIDMKKTIASY